LQNKKTFLKFKNMKNHLFLMTLAAAAIAFAGCKKDSAEDPSLAVNPASIDAAYTAGSYTMNVTANVAWTAAVNSGATWCTVQPATGNGSGTVAVNVAESPVMEARAATVTVSGGTLAQTVTVTQAARTTPPNAASSQTWTFGNQLWSDAIHVPTCTGGTSFTESDTGPKCRSYTEGANTWFYYNWYYVNQNAAVLCPSPWRVPTQSDFNTLKDNTTNATLINTWGYGGLYFDTSYDSDSMAGYWSATWNSNDPISNAWYLNYAHNAFVVTFYPLPMGMQVRCVKDT
jgi:hypothetical protein